MWVQTQNSTDAADKLQLKTQSYWPYLSPQHVCLIQIEIRTGPMVQMNKNRVNSLAEPDIGETQNSTELPASHVLTPS